MRTFLLPILLIFLALPATASAPLCSHVVLSDSLNEFITELQGDPGALANQTAFRSYIELGGGGACAPATAFNFLQILRKAYAQPLLSNQEVLSDAYEHLPILKKGRVTNSQFLDLLLYLEKKYLPEIPGQQNLIRVEQAPQSESTEEISSSEASVHTWTQFNPEILVAGPGEMKIAIYTIHEGTRRLGRHFVVIKNAEPGRVSVVDPSNPAKTYSYSLSEQNDGAWRLTRPDESGFTKRTVDTIMTLQIP